MERSAEIEAVLTHLRESVEAVERAAHAAGYPVHDDALFVVSYAQAKAILPPASEPEED